MRRRARGLLRTCSNRDSTLDEMEMMVPDGTPALSNLKTAVPTASCADSVAAHEKPFNTDLIRSVAAEYVKDVTEPLQMNIFCQQPREFAIVSENGDITYNLHKARTFNPFGATVWELSDGSRESPGTIIVRKSPIKRQTSFERRDGSLLASMCNRLVMTGGDFNWETKIYRWQMTTMSVPLKMQLIEVGTREEVATMQGSWVFPWSVKQDNITIFSENRDPMWIRIVIASGMSEASRVSRHRSSSSGLGKSGVSGGSACGMLGTVPATIRTA